MHSPFVERHGVELLTVAEHGDADVLLLHKVSISVREPRCATAGQGQVSVLILW